MEEILNKILKTVTEIENKVTVIETDVKEMKGQLKVVYDQTANLTEFQTDAKMKFDIVLDELKEIRKEISNVEIITSSNWNDIAKLKAIK